MTQEFKNVMQERKFISEDIVIGLIELLKNSLKYFEDAVAIHRNPSTICYKERDKAQALLTKYENAIIGFNGEDKKESLRSEQIIFHAAENCRKDMSYFNNLGETLIVPAIDTTLNLKIR